MLESLYTPPLSPGLLALQRDLHAFVNFNAWARDIHRPFPLRQLAELFPHELHLNMPGSDTNLLRAPVELPQRIRVIVRGNGLGVVVASDIAEAEKDVWEAVLEKRELGESYGEKEGRKGTYNGIQLIVNLRLDSCRAAPRIVILAVYAVGVSRLCFVVEGAVALLGGERVRIIG